MQVELGNIITAVVVILGFLVSTWDIKKKQIEKSNDILNIVTSHIVKQDEVNGHLKEALQSLRETKVLEHREMNDSIKELHTKTNGIATKLEKLIGEHTSFKNIHGGQGGLK